MLVFAVLLDKSGLTTNQGNIIVIHKPDHQLPIFVITFNNNSMQLAKQLVANGQAMIRGGAAAATAFAGLTGFRRPPPIPAPPALPSGWTAHWHGPMQRYFFQNMVTRGTTWTIPAGPAISAQEQSIRASRKRRRWG